MIEEWEQRTQRSAPPALRAFSEGDPDQALDAMLDGAAGTTVAQLGAAGTIGNWLSAAPAEMAIARTIDGAVKRRLDSDWQPPAEPGLPARRRALRLMRLFDVVAVVPGKLPESAAALRDRFDTRDSALAPWSPTPSQDPLGRYLLAIARNQRDRSLAPHWFNLCRFPASVPLFRVEYGIAGLRGLPPAADDRDDEFPSEVASGLRILADGMRAAIEDGRVDRTAGAETLMRVAKVAVAAYPLAGWADALLADVDEASPLTAELLREMAQLDERMLTEQALRRMIEKDSLMKAPVERPPARRDRAPSHRQRPHRDAERRLLASLKKSNTKAVEQMQTLIDDRLAKAERSGGSLEDGLGRLLTQASTAARRAKFRKHSVRWAEEAMRWEPWDARTWTCATAALRATDKHQEALDIGWRAHARFPYNYYVWLEVGQALAAQGRVKSAEAILTEAMHRLPHEASPTSVYAELLLSTGRPAEALAILEPAVEHFSALDEIPGSAVNLWAGLTAALISTGSIPEALETATNASKLFPQNQWAQRMPKGFEAFRRERNRRDAAYQAEQQAPPPPPKEGALFSSLSEARMLRQSARRTSDEQASEEAAELLARNQKRGANEPLFVAEKTLSLVDRGQPSQALRELERSAFANTVNPSIALAAVRARRGAMLEASGNGNGDGESPQRRYSPAALAELTGEIRDAVQTNPALRPVAQLTEAQAAASMFDGEVLDGERRRIYGELKAWMQRVATRDVDEARGGDAEELEFEGSWTDSVSAIWTDLGDAPTGSEIAERANEHDSALDALDELFVHRMSVV